MDLTSRLREIVRPQRPAEHGAARLRELTYEPDDGLRYERTPDPDAVASALGGRWLTTDFGQCLAIDRRYESDRWHGDVRIGECELTDPESLRLLDPALITAQSGGQSGADCAESARASSAPIPAADQGALESSGSWGTVFVDLETTGLSGGAGTVVFLIGCGFFDLGAFQIRQFLLTSYSAERALLAAAAHLFARARLIVTYNGKTFDVPVMETRWAFHRMRAPLEGVPHFDMLHPARRLWRTRSALGDEGGCRLSTLERVLLNIRRVGDVDGFEIPGRFFQFLRTADPRPLEPVLEHNRLDLVSLAAVTSRALRLTAEGESACRDGGEALALGRVLERAGAPDRAEACYRRATESACTETRAEAFYRLGLRCRRERRFAEAAGCWRELLNLTSLPARHRAGDFGALRAFAIEALAIHHEHRDGNLETARELALFALGDWPTDGIRASGMRHRLARLDRKLAKRRTAEPEGPALQFG